MHSPLIRRDLFGKHFSTLSTPLPNVRRLITNKLLLSGPSVSDCTNLSLTPWQALFGQEGVTDNKFTLRGEFMTNMRDVNNTALINFVW